MGSMLDMPRDALFGPVFAELRRRLRSRYASAPLPHGPTGSNDRDHQTATIHR
jgi:hypothetical protein